MNIYQVAGIGMLATPFIVIGIILGHSAGGRVVLVSFGAAALLVAWVWAGVHLLFK